jgi:hypothetical protein
MMWLIFVAGALVGWLGHRGWTDGILLAQRDAHKKEMDEIFVEVKRLRAQVAALIGRT